jgi:RNA polymerase sigma factor (sigma-70 family)
MIAPAAADHPAGYIEKIVPFSLRQHTNSSDAQGLARRRIMVARPLELVLRHFGADGRSDRELLERFRTNRDEAAFAALVHRHQYMVRGVCRSVLRHCQDAEDACQATFLVLAKQAASIRDTNALAGWLHGVAFRIASQAKKQAARRRLCEQRAASQETSAADDLSWREVQSVLHEELQRLPHKYRLPLIACCLEGRTRDEAARQLGWTFGAFKGMLDRGRDLLRKRLERRGVTLAAALASITLAQDTTAATSMATAQTALAYAARQMTGLASTHAVSLAKAALKSTMPLKSTLAALLVAGIALVGAMGYHTTPTADPPVQEPRAPLPTPEQAKPKVDRFGDPLPPNAVARLGSVRLRHGDAVSGLAFAPDGKTVASAGFDGTVRVWDVTTGKELQRLEDTHFPGIGLGAMLSIEYSPDGKTIAIARLNHPPCLWDLASGKVLLEFGGKTARASWITLSRDGKLAAYAGSTDVLYLADVATGKVLHGLTGHQGFVFSVVFSPDGKTFASSGNDKTIRLWDIETAQELRRFEGVPDASGCLAFSPDGKTLASGNHANSLIRLWDVATAKEIRTLALKGKRDGCSVSGRKR